MEFEVKNSQYRRFNEQENRVEYRQVLSVRNSSTNADKTILVVTVDGVVLGGDGPASFRTHGGQLRVLPDQTSEQLRRRLVKTLHQGYDLQEHNEHKCDVPQLHDLLKSNFGMLKAEMMLKSCTGHLNYIKRIDGSAVLEGEEIPKDAIIATSVDHEPKPAGWGAW